MIIRWLGYERTWFSKIVGDVSTWVRDVWFAKLVGAIDCDEDGSAAKDFN